ncbi:hypothetical protein M5K25_010836 [Dendrobium thyrsiflorum]|uniref:NB-ARC domain-containing protein n=1 Tax=Dendrobium thyrsiflorum TaxID=117978 RepID=A0ABD0V1Y4_DENTH
MLVPYLSRINATSHEAHFMEVCNSLHTLNIAEINTNISEVCVKAVGSGIGKDLFAGVKMPSLNFTYKVDPTQCSQVARRNVTDEFIPKFVINGDDLKPNHAEVIKAIIKNLYTNKDKKVSYEEFDTKMRSKANGHEIIVLVEAEKIKDDFDPNLKRLAEVVQKLDKDSAGVSTFLHLLEGTKQEQQRSLPKNDLIGRDKDKEFVIQWLRKPSNELPGTNLYINISLLSIVGHGGMGKTTLLQHEKTEEIDLKMWVCVSNNFDVRKDIADMLEPLKMSRPPLDTLYALQNESYLLQITIASSTLVQFNCSKVESPHLDWGKPLHVIILKSAFKVFDPGIWHANILSQYSQFVGCVAIAVLTNRELDAIMPNLWHLGGIEFGALKLEGVRLHFQQFEKRISNE